MAARNALNLRKADRLAPAIQARGITAMAKDFYRGLAKPDDPIYREGPTILVPAWTPNSPPAIRKSRAVDPEPPAPDDLATESAAIANAEADTESTAAHGIEQLNGDDVPPSSSPPVQEK